MEHLQFKKGKKKKVNGGRGKEGLAHLFPRAFAHLEQS